MNSFWKNTFSSFVGSSLAFIVVVVIITLVTFGIIGGLVASLEGKGKKTSIDDQSILELRLDAPIIDRGNENQFNINFSTLQPEVSIGLNHLLEDIEKAGKDERIEGIFLNLSSVMASPSSLEDIHRSVSDFKSTGKWVVAYAETYSQSAYYLASLADEIYLYPEGGLEWKGLFTELAFFKQMLEKLDIEVQIIRGKNNKFKSAVEPFMYDEMSEANREQIMKFLNTIWNDWVTDVSESRGISVDELNSIADGLSSFNPKSCVQLGLIDGLKYGDEVRAELEQRVFGQAEEQAEDNYEEAEDAEKKEDDRELNLVSLADYRNVKVKGEKKEEEKDGEETKFWEKDEVAVIYAIGGIESGEGDDETIGSDRIAGALKDAREDEDIKAVVLRINSPGGSALASDVIWRETQLLKEAGKPFVVSMGDVAASGGYYIAAGADKIYANETTITGSIGVFGVIPVTGKFFENKMGITFDDAKTNEHSNIMTTTSALDNHEYTIIQENVEQIYDRFLSIVAEGRNMEKSAVDSIAQGRVWAGADALSIGLVDELGNLDDAVEAAAEMAGITDYRTKDLPKLIDPFEEMMKELGGDVEAKVIDAHLTQRFELYQQIKEVEKLSKMRGVQARMPYSIKVK